MKNDGEWRAHYISELRKRCIAILLCYSVYFNCINFCGQKIREIYAIHKHKLSRTDALWVSLSYTQRRETQNINLIIKFLFRLFFANINFCELKETIFFAFINLRKFLSAKRNIFSVSQLQTTRNEFHFGLWDCYEFISGSLKLWHCKTFHFAPKWKLM